MLQGGYVRLARRGTLLLLLLVAPAVFASVDAEGVRRYLRLSLEQGGPHRALFVRGETIFASEKLAEFYERRDFAPAWSGANGPLKISGALLEALRASDDHGLNPALYRLDVLERAVDAARSDPQDVRAVAEADLLLTEAFVRHAAHLLAGHLDPERIGASWFIARPEKNLAELLRKGVASRNIAGALREVEPQHPRYRDLVRAHVHYLKLARNGGWRAVPEGTLLRPGDRDARVIRLRERLAVTEGPISVEKAPEVYDRTLAAAVESFQRRHGLDADGVVGASTIRALNVPAEARLQQIRVNLERWRWLPTDFGERHIMVNIAGFRLEVYEQGQAVMTMKAVVGKEYRMTPIISERMTQIVFSPFWNVPASIAAADVLPKVKRDRSYLTRQGIKVYRGGQQVDPSAIDWSRVSSANLPYHFRQDPGRQNSLGRVKFVLPNRFDVFLHDTPETELFARSARGFSSGCIRVEKPVELAQYLLRGQQGWSREAIVAAMNRRQERPVALAEAVPVHLLYWTAWAEGPSVHFRDDIYDRDRPLLTAMKQRQESGGVYTAP
jgi:L,D-transpeptidase YcbB